MLGINTEVTKEAIKHQSNGNLTNTAGAQLSQARHFGRKLREMKLLNGGAGDPEFESLTLSSKFINKLQLSSSSSFPCLPLPSLYVIGNQLYTDTNDNNEQANKT